MKLGAFEAGESQLSFALLFMSIRAFSEKKNYFNFSLHVLGAGHPTCREELFMLEMAPKSRSTYARSSLTPPTL